MKTTKNYELVEMQVAASSGTRVMFQDVPQLRGGNGSADVIVEHLEAFSIQAVSSSPLGNTMISIADFKKAFLVLVVAGKEKIKQFPLPALNRIIPDGTTAANFVPAVRDLADVELKNVEWSKSYVQFASAPAATAFSILLGVHYRVQ
jgi:hypothetical protein